MDLDLFAKALREKAAVERLTVGPEVFDALRKDAQKNPSSVMPLFPIQIRVSNAMPPNAAAFVDKDGNILGVMYL